MILLTLHFFLSILLSEALLRLSAYGNISFSLPLVLFSLSAAILLGLICSLFKNKATKIVTLCINLVLFIFYVVHLIYQHTFKSFLSIVQIGMGGDALTSFGHETFLSAMEVKWYILGMLLPVLVAVFLLVSKITLKHTKAKGIAVSLLAFALVYAVCVLMLPVFGTEAYSPYDIYHDTFVLSLSEKNFGTLTSARLEIRGLFFGKQGSKIIIDEEIEEAEETPAAIEYPYNNMDIDFDALIQNESDETLKSLHQYFASKNGTRQNEYTGMFKDYNIVYLACESFSPYLIDKDRTPVLYKMANEGFVFNNYYSTVCDNTSNSEYAYLTSMLPDSSLLGKGWNTFYEYNSCTASKNNYLPFTIGNQLQKEGVQSWGFHYYYGKYYGRRDTHPNFGMECYFMSAGLKKSSDWPTSDLDMMKLSLEPYVLKGDENGNIGRFGAYYLTFSGHMYYNFDSNRIALINKSVSDDMPYSEATRAYVSCNQELENALEYMLEEFENKGILDNTLFVLIPDHYPYTLGLKNLSELAGKDLLADAYEKQFNQYTGCLLMWSPSMTEPVVVDKVCCELDILPTISNLLGFEYDSRMMMGNDILSNSEGLAVLADRSYITKDIAFDANSGTVYQLSDNILSDEYIGRLTNSVKNMFTVSTEMLYNDYYRHVFLP